MEKQPLPPAAVRAAPRRRLRQSSLRPYRVCPRFSEAEWTTVQEAADAADLAPAAMPPQPRSLPRPVPAPLPRLPITGAACRN